MSILLINMSKVISLKEQKNILVYLYASWLIQYWLIVCDRAHQLIRLIPHFRALCSSTDIHWLKCVTMFHCSVLDSPHSHQPHHIGWSAGFFTQSFANPYLVILPPAPMQFMLKKIPKRWYTRPCRTDCMTGIGLPGWLAWTGWPLHNGPAVN